MKAVVFLCLVVPLCVCAQQGFNWNNNGGSSGSPGRDPAPTACSSNYASCGCCLMEKQMTRMIEYYNHSHKALSDYLAKTTNAINQIRATRSSFSVALANQNQCLGPFNVNMNIAYGTVTINLGNNYDASTGVYKAPVTGVYSLAVSVYSNFAGQSGTRKACANLSVNGNIVAQVIDKAVGDHQDSSSVVITQKLTAGDKVFVVLPAGCSLCGTHREYNTFTGFFLYRN